MIIIDAHQDLAYNMLEFGRDYTRSAADTRLIERGTETPARTGDSLLGWPDYQRGKVALIFATLFAAPEHARLHSWETLVYRDFYQANALYRAQIDVYLRLTDRYPDKFRLVLNRKDMDEILSEWEREQEIPSPDDDEETARALAPGGDGRKSTVRAGEQADQRDREEARADGNGHPMDDNETGEAVHFKGRGRPVGLVLLMEGAEGVQAPEELDEWWELGLRIIGPAWSGTRFCGGTRRPGPLTPEGYELLDGMAEVGFGLDISHMDEQAVLQALDHYPGTVIASHSNAFALLKGIESNRFLSDRVIRGLIERDGVIGVQPINFFLKPGWKIGDGRHDITLQHVAAHIDYVCQMAGDALHVGLGADFDGGFGVQSVPADIDTIADIRKLIPLLGGRGYSETDIAAIMGKNWMDRLQQILPEE